MRLAANVIRSNIEKLMVSWEEEIRVQIPASNDSSDLALRNQLPNLLDDIADILERYEALGEIKKYEQYEEIIRNSLDHGRHRAATSHYTAEQILEEYIVLHRILTGLLMEQDCYTREVGIVLKYTIENAMLNSTRSFSNSMQEMREKLVGALAHDIRTPISVAYFALDIMGHSEDQEKLESLRQMGLKSLRKSLGLLEGLLDAISVKAGEGMTLEFEEIDVVKEVEWVYYEASEIYAAKIKFQTEKKEIKGVFDGTAIRRIVENLVSNAVKYGDSEQPVSIKIEDSGDEVIVSVHNFGEPIPENSRKSIFKFLSRSHQNQPNHMQSWGIGLSLVKSVAMAHGGHVELESNEQDGTTFSIFLNKTANKTGKVRTELSLTKKAV
ncbi:MAG: HAMP domain-containing sensor histidine kinase [Salegentibacter sp.]